MIAYRAMNECTRLFFLLVILGVYCAKQNPQENTNKDDQFVPTFNYTEIQQRAKSFTPQIGVSGGTLTLPFYSEPVSFNPILVANALPHMYEGLVRINGISNEPEPGLAESWEVSADSLVWTFHLRKIGQWSDQTPLTSGDVLFTFNDLIYNPNISPNVSREMFVINGERITLEALDAYTVRFTLPEIFAPFLGYMNQEILPQHIFKQYVTQGTFSDALPIMVTPSDMVGTGPFILKSYAPFNAITYVKNALYWQKDDQGNTLPYFDTLIYAIVSGLDEALQFFKRGEIDYLAVHGPELAELNESDPHYNIVHLGPSFDGTFLTFNQNPLLDKTSNRPFVEPYKLEWMQVKKFRKAVAYAVNRTKIIKEILDERGFAPGSVMSPAIGYFYDAEVEPYQYDLKQAKTLLGQAGFKDSDQDGICEDKNGKMVELTLLVNRENIYRQKIAEKIRDDLKQVGIKLELEMIDHNALQTRILTPPYSWEMAIIGLGSHEEPHLAKSIWSSHSAAHLWYPQQSKPATTWEAQIDSLFLMGCATNDRKKRKEIYDHWQRIAADEVPLVPVVRFERILGITSKLGNLNPSVHGGLLHNLAWLYIMPNNVSISSAENSE